MSPKFDLTDFMINALWVAFCLLLLSFCGLAVTGVIWLIALLIESF